MPNPQGLSSDQTVVKPFLMKDPVGDQKEHFRASVLAEMCGQKWTSGGEQLRLVFLVILS